MLLNSILLQEAAAQGGGASGLIMIVLLIVIFYFFMIRPQQKRQKEIRKFRESLGKGDKIVTAGGIHGTIRDVKEDSFIVEVADGVRLRIDKGSVYPSAAEANQAAQNQEQK
jgi:preprotein translocase subunit YajC